MRKLILILTILLLPCVAAFWDNTMEDVSIADGVTYHADGYSVKVLEVGDIDKRAVVQVSSNGEIIATDIVSPYRSLTIPNVLKIDFIDYADEYEYGKKVKLRIYHWIDGRFIKANFPKVMNFNALYDVYALVENTGSKDILFRVELTQPGEFDRASGKFDVNGILVPRFVDVSKPIQYHLVPPGAVARAEYVSVRPYAQSPSDLRVEKSGDIQFVLSYNGMILDVLHIPDIKFSSEKSAYIEDAEYSPVVARDIPFETRLSIVNGGIATTGGDRNKFNLNMITEGFEFEEVTYQPSYSSIEKRTGELQIDDDVIRGEITPFTSQEWKFAIRPLVAPGLYNVEMNLEYGQKILDTHNLQVRVEKGGSTIIESIDVPKEVDFGDIVPMEVTILNLGEGRTVEVQIVAPSMIEVPISKVLKLNAGQRLTSVFNVEAIGQGMTPIIVEVLKVQDGGKNYDPYSKGLVITQRTTSMAILTPDMVRYQEPVEEEMIEVKEQVVPAKTAPIVEEKQEVILPPPLVQRDEVAEEESILDSETALIGLFIIVFLALLGLIGIAMMRGSR